MLHMGGNVLSIGDFRGCWECEASLELIGHKTLPLGPQDFPNISWKMASDSSALLRL